MMKIMKRSKSITYFLVSLILTVIIYPFIGQLKIGGLIESVLLTLILLFSVWAIGDSRKILIWAILLVLVPLGAKWINYIRSDFIPREVVLVTGFLFVAFVIARLYLFIFRALRVNWEVLCTSIAVYILLALLWFFIYEFIAMRDPNAFAFTIGPAETHSMRGFNGLYYSFLALCASSYGAIIPISGAARLISVLEQTVGMFYITILIARLVSLYTSEDEAEARNSSRQK